MSGRDTTGPASGRARGDTPRGLTPGRGSLGLVPEHPEDDRLALAEIAPAGDAARLREEGFTSAQHGAPGLELDLDQAVSHGDELDVLVREARRRRLPGREARDVGAQPSPRVVQERPEAPPAALARLIPAAEAVAGRRLAPQELVQRDAEPSGELEERVEREAPLAALRLRDRARGHAGEACDVALAQTARLP